MTTIVVEHIVHDDGTDWDVNLYMEGTSLTRQAARDLAHRLLTVADTEPDLCDVSSCPNFVCDQGLCYYHLGED